VGDLPHLSFDLPDRGLMPCRLQRLPRTATIRIDEERLLRYVAVLMELD